MVISLKDNKKGIVHLLKAPWSKGLVVHKGNVFCTLKKEYMN